MLEYTGAHENDLAAHGYSPSPRIALPDTDGHARQLGHRPRQRVHVALAPAPAHPVDVHRCGAVGRPGVGAGEGGCDVMPRAVAPTEVPDLEQVVPSRVQRDRVAPPIAGWSL